MSSEERQGWTVSFSPPIHSGGPDHGCILRSALVTGGRGIGEARLLATVALDRAALGMPFITLPNSAS